MTSPFEEEFDIELQLSNCSTDIISGNNPADTDHSPLLVHVMQRIKNSHCKLSLTHERYET